MTRPSSFNNMVGAFEMTIRQNHLSGPNGCLPSCKLCARRRSAIRMAQKKKPQILPKQQSRRASTGGTTLKATTKQQKQSRRSRTSSSSSSKKEKPDFRWDKARKEDQKKPKEKAPKKRISLPPPPSKEERLAQLAREKEEEEELEEEVRALKRRVYRLQGKLNNTLSNGQNELDTINRSTHERKQQHHQDKLGSASEHRRAVLTLACLGQGGILSDNKKKIMELRQANKVLRHEQDKLIHNIGSLAEDNTRLQSENMALHVKCVKAYAIREYKEETYAEFIDRIPGCKHRIEKQSNQVGRRGRLASFEHGRKNKYEDCNEAIVSMIERKSKDKELVAALQKL